MSKPCIAIGPEVNRASWDWIGFDIGRELSKYYEVLFFDKDDYKPPPCEIVIMVKDRQYAKFWQRIHEQRSKIIYCPVDYYLGRNQLEEDGEFLKQCSAVLVHCERLRPLCERYCKRVEFVEHHNRFGLAEQAPYRHNGYAVWVGAIEHLPRVVYWLQKHPLDMEIKFVTDYPHIMRDGLCGTLPISDSHQIFKWSPRRQRDIMAGARVAFDIKGEDFDQMYRSPVKAQKYIISGLPFAINSKSYATEYFQAQGFPLASFEQRRRWLSRGYWKETQIAGKKLRERLTLENVGLDFKRIIDQVLQDK